MPKMDVWFPNPNEIEPTVNTGGLKRMIEIWETLRDRNSGGYGPSVVTACKTWPDHPVDPSHVTSCSPFTATVIGMMFDPKGGSDDRLYEPLYNNGKTPLPPSFYTMHQGDMPEVAGAWTKVNSYKWGNPCSSPASLLYFNLGYEVDLRDMRRGDLVGFDWTSGHGHATFCWDVHLNDKGEVDAFIWLSANGIKVSKGKYWGPGICVGPHAFKYEMFVDGKDSGFKKCKKNRDCDPMFEDKELYIRWGGWQCVPHTRRKAEVDLSTFKEPGPLGLTDASDPKYGVSHTARAVRLWGFPPPDRPQDPKSKYQEKFDLARQLALPGEKLAESFATGKGKAVDVHIPNVPATTVKGADIAKDPQAVQKAEPKKVKQDDDKPAQHQHVVEDALTELFAAGWIEKDPGKAQDLNNDETQAAVKDFQQKWKIHPANGVAGPKTRTALLQALADLKAGKPNPHEKPPPPKEKPKPVLDDAYFLRNRVDAGGNNWFVLRGEHLDQIASVQVVLTEPKSGREAKLDPIREPGSLVRAVRMPASFTTGSVLLARFEAKASDGSTLEHKTEAPIYVGGVEPEQPPWTPPDDGWPWDETKWPKQMRDVLAELRAETKPSGKEFTRREVTQYGIKEKIKSGSTPVLDESGQELGRVDETSLFLADIEGTMRLGGRILNIARSGNVYDIYVEKIIDGKKVRKPKPNRVKFDPQKSRWKDVTDKMPWGAGARAALIPFRTLAHNYKTETPLFHRKVYIEQLDGMRLPTGETHNGMCIVTDVGGMAPPGHQFDFFVGREDRHISIPTLGVSAGGSICNVLILGESDASRGKKK